MEEPNNICKDCGSDEVFVKCDYPALTTIINKMNITLDTYRELEEKGVYIHYLPEHYNDGSNLNFSIEFRKHKTQTGWYNDNHEFGDVSDTMYKSLQLAKWYLEDPKRIDLINSGYHNPEYIKYKDDMKEFLSTITKF